VRSLAAWLLPVVAELAPAAATLGVCLADDAALRRANRRYRGEDRTTDVLSFPGEAKTEGWHLGDILISLPRAERHGVLHCLGHDHEADGGEMAALELRLRERWLPAAGC
jgi:probable rRNA maturation factor